PAGDVQGIDRYIGPQRLQDRVAPGDDLAARLVATRGPAGPRAASPVGSRLGAGLRLLVGLVVRPVDSLRGGSLALQTLAALTTRAGGRALLRSRLANGASPR